VWQDRTIEGDVDKRCLGIQSVADESLLEGLKVCNVFLCWLEVSCVWASACHETTDAQIAKIGGSCVFDDGKESERFGYEHGQSEDAVYRVD